jgi:hypothetical protein
MSWLQLGKDIDGDAENDKSGTSVSLSSNGRRVAIGAPFNDKDVGNGGTISDTGHVRIYEYNGTKWTQMGSDIDGESDYNKSGSSVSLSGDGTRIAIGAPFNGGYTGHVRIYEYNSSNTTWTQLGEDIDGEAQFDQNGFSVSLSGDGTRVVIGAPFNSKDDGTGSFTGHVRIYEYNSSNTKWTQLGSDIDGESTFDLSGFSVSLSSDGTHVAIGAINDDGIDGTISNTGHVRIFEFSLIEPPNAGGDPHIKPIIGRQYDLPHNETSYMLLNIAEENLSIVGQCWKLPESQYSQQLNRIKDKSRKNSIKTLLNEATYFKYIKIQLNNEIVIYDMDTLEQVKYEPTKFINHSLEKDIKRYEQIKESQIVRAIEGLFGTSINYTSIKCIEKFISLQLTNGNILKIRLAKDRGNILYRNSISIVDTNDIQYNNININNMHGALVRKEIVEVDFTKNLEKSKIN